MNEPSVFKNSTEIDQLVEPEALPVPELARNVGPGSRRNRGHHLIANDLDSAEAIRQFPLQRLDQDGVVGQGDSAGDGVVATNLVLQLDDPVEQGLGGGRTPGNVDVHRDDPVAPAHDGIRVVVIAPAIRAGSHRNHPTGLRHLVIDLPQSRGHLVAERTGDDHDVGLARTRPEDDAEAIEIVAGGPGLHHLDGAAGQTEGHGPERTGASPVDEVIDLGGDEAALGKALRVGAGGQSHSSAPFFHS